MLSKACVEKGEGNVAGAFFSANAGRQLVVHGTDDRVISFFMGMRLFEKATDPRCFYSLPEAGHNDILQVGEESYLMRLREFIDSLPGLSSTGMARGLQPKTT